MLGGGLYDAGAYQSNGAALVAVPEPAGFGVSGAVLLAISLAGCRARRRMGP